MLHCIKVLLDPRVIINTIFTKFIQKIKMKNCKLEKQYLFGIVVECNFIWITKEILLLTTKVLKHKKEFAYDIINMANYDVILKYLWMEKHNPNINWISRTIEFDRCSCTRAPNPHGPRGGPVDEDEVLCNTRIRQHKQDACRPIRHCCKRKRVKKKIQDRDKKDKGELPNIPKEY